MNRDYSAITLDREIYGSLFIAEGLLAYASASGQRQYRDLAVDIVREMVALYDSPGYTIDMTGYLGPGNEPLVGARVQGVSMVLLRFATQLLRMSPDPEFEALAADCVRNLLERHWNPAFGLNIELVTHDYQFPSGDYSQFAYTGHTVEAMWMVMDEALRRGDNALFGLAAERFRRHVEVSWDGVYGGVFRGLRHVDRNEWLLDRVLWPQEEVLIGCLMLIEQGDEWAGKMFRKMYEYVRGHYPLSKHGLPLWIATADRKVTFEPHYNRIENYHHPRHLMLNLQMLERLRARPAAGSELH
jgi:mannose/cellobiose epimerase-like protein (N-acyl-D-glucosamine 2-epimerase family)